MPIKTRYLVEPILKDVVNKMVFLGGPRQVGKTTLAVELVGSHFKSAYFSWDKIDQRKAALKSMYPPEAQLILLDEFHKHLKWKTWLKGEYDSLKNRHHFLLTGSARLDTYRKGGDSLQGRYHHYRLHPFSVAELSGQKRSHVPFAPLDFSDDISEESFKVLLTFGGFPEPLVKQDERDLRRWHNERMERFFREDIRDLTLIQDLGNLTLLSELLPERVSSVLSINSLAEDLQVNFRTVANWLDVFERLYFSFRLPSYQSRKIASVRKEKKLYLWDWSGITTLPEKFENMIASHLLKFCHFLEDHDGWKMGLSYLRDSTGRETDFLVTVDNKPWFAVEVKSQARQIARPLLYFRDKLKIPFCYQVLNVGGVDYEKGGIRVMSAPKFLSALV